MANHYSEAARDDAVRRLVICKESLNSVSLALGISKPTLRSWKKQYLDEHPELTSSHSGQQKFDTLVATSSMTDEDRGAYVRKNGLFLSQLEDWQSAAISALEDPPLSRRAYDDISKECISLHELIKAKDQEIRQLHQDVAQRDKALEAMNKEITERNSSIAELTLVLQAQKKMLRYYSERTTA